MFEADTWNPTDEQMEELGHLPLDGETPLPVHESWWRGEITEERADEMLREWARRTGVTS